MLNWLSENWINIVLAAGVALIAGLIIALMARDRKAGKPACGGNCAKCGACCACAKRGAATQGETK